MGTSGAHPRPALAEMEPLSKCPGIAPQSGIEGLRSFVSIPIRKIRTCFHNVSPRTGAQPSHAVLPLESPHSTAVTGGFRPSQSVNGGITSGYPERANVSQRGAPHATRVCQAVEGCVTQSVRAQGRVFSSHSPPLFRKLSTVKLA